MTPEGKIKKMVKSQLEELGAYYHMPVQNGMGKPTLDFVCCVPRHVTQDMVGRVIGLYVAVEAKAPGGKPTPRQEITMKEIHAAHGIAVVYDGSDGGVIDALRLGRGIA